MEKLLITGKKELSGRIYISGSKNASLPILASTILSENVKLTNIPLVKDIFTMVELLKFVGLKINIHKKTNTIEIKNNNVKGIVICLESVICHLGKTETHKSKKDIKSPRTNQRFV